jgi:hypothetical protein
VPSDLSLACSRDPTPAVVSMPVLPLPAGALLFILPLTWTLVDAQSILANSWIYKLFYLLGSSCRIRVRLNDFVQFSV